MNGKEIYFKKIKPQINDFYKKTSGIEENMTKEIINETMLKIVPIVKKISNFVESKNYKKDPYLEAINDAYIKNPGISVRTINKQKISSFLYDIKDYIAYYEDTL